MTEPVLSVRNLTVRLPRGADRENAIEGVSFDIGPREIVCIVGESGSGKSVTAQAVMGLLTKRDLVVTAGETLLQGEDTTKARISRLRELRGTRMGMIFQEPMTALNPVQRVGQQIAEVLEIHTDLSAAEQRQRVLDIMQAVKLPDPDLMIDAYPHQLSGGQRQRIMIAAALVLDPALLIADEPTTALDVTTQAQILRLIKEMQSRRNTGVMFITHDFGVVSEIADRVVVMQEGEIVQIGTPVELFERPQHTFVGHFIGSPGMNVLPASVRDGGVWFGDTRVEVDMTPWTIPAAGRHTKCHTKCGWTPFAGMTAGGRVRRVVLRGRTVYEDGEVLAAPGSGMVIPGQ